MVFAIVVCNRASVHRARTSITTSTANPNTEPPTNIIKVTVNESKKVIGAAQPVRVTLDCRDGC